ncbi:MAG: DUF4296 domain-containing protein [Bacteroidales bacterium]|nr:DUF4296 domain-containing protein [Bacteroidales bacterium]
MRRAPVYVLVLFCFLALSGCGRGARVIPERKMVRIYTAMFLSDQWIRDNQEARKMADTTLFFDPIFRANGVTFEDYDRSVHYYLDRPDKYAKILTKASERLRAESTSLQAVVDAQRAHQRERDHYHSLYQQKDFTTDSSRWAGIEPLWPERPSPADTVLAVPADSLFTLMAPDTLERIRPVDRRDRPSSRRKAGQIDDFNIESK